MLQFFRKIRKKLAHENQLLKYLRYAFGEIVLVVIGILIALQINNWNITKQQRKTEQVNLIALLEEFKKNNELLNKEIDDTAEIIVGIENIIRSFESSVLDTISEQTLAKYLFQSVAKTLSYIPNSGVLSELISSGNLKLIQNQTLKHKLAGFGSRVQLVKGHENKLALVRQNMENDFLNTGNYKALLTAIGEDLNWKTPFDSVSNKPLFYSMATLNKHLAFKSYCDNTTRLFYLPLKEEIEVIIDLISSELNN